MKHIYKYETTSFDDNIKAKLLKHIQTDMFIQLV